MSDEINTTASGVSPAGHHPTLQVQLRLLDDGIEAPSYAHPGDAGADLRSRIDVELAPGERALVPTGIALALPFGYAAFIHPRSGLATKHGLTIVNSPGTVDAGYRGELSVTLLNTDSRHSIRLSRGDRIAQMVIQRVERAGFVTVAELPDSVRGAGGFGSTGGFAAVDEAATPSAATKDTAL
ncbi:dUTP diphosphatase [Specibacter sp. NPDC057265]|uniref:dUTP diphosphatase n=1 Tax=Specibacter sp. NPDC057265 TaxID=3346075 RepID=UPI003631E121